jgi:IS605 OrfB family transposase
MGIGTVRLIGTRAIETFPLEQIKRVRLVRRADGYFVQFAVHADRTLPHECTGSPVGIDLGLVAFLTDSNGGTVANPRFLRKAERKLKRLQRRVSRKQKGSHNRKKAIKGLAKGHLKVSRQRKDFAAKTVQTLIQSHDLVAYEDLKVRNLVRNRRLAKSISDAAWGLFLQWLRYYGQIAAVPVIAVPPAYTSQDCSGTLPDGTRCQTRVMKALSVRTHICPRCGLVLDRDENAACNILAAAQALLTAS